MADDSGVAKYFSSEEMFLRAYNAIGVAGAAQAEQMRFAQAEPEQKCPAYRVVAEP